LDGLGKEMSRDAGDAFPTIDCQQAAWCTGIDSSMKENFSSIDIADPCDSFLIKQSNFNGTARSSQPRDKVSASNAKSIGAESIRTAGGKEPPLVNESHCTQSSAIPEHKL
jgi:hypothetical protein